MAEKKQSEEILKITDDYKPFKKPASDYYRLDVVVRKTIKTDRGYTVMCNDTITDYRQYLKKASKENDTSITKYLHELIDADMEKHPEWCTKDTKK